MTANDVLNFIGDRLTHHWQQTFFAHNAPTPIITASGWTDGHSRHPKLLSLANCLNAQGDYNEPGRLEFSIVCYPIPTHGSSLIVLGDLRATNGKLFNQVKKRVIKLLNKSTNKLDEKILNEMMLLVLEGSRSINTNSVNGRVKGSRMDRRKEGIIYKAIPEETSYSLPGFSTPTMTVSGIMIKNDPIEVGTAVIGGPPRLNKP